MWISGSGSGRRWPTTGWPCAEQMPYGPMKKPAETRAFSWEDTWVRRMAPDGRDSNHERKRPAEPGVFSLYAVSSGSAGRDALQAGDHVGRHLDHGLRGLGVLVHVGAAGLL